MMSYWEYCQQCYRGRKAAKLYYTLRNTNGELVHAGNSNDRVTICRDDIQGMLIDGEVVMHWT